MADELSRADVRRLRVHAQHLAGRPAKDTSSAVRRVVGIQAQASAPARLAVRARTARTTGASVDKAAAPAGGKRPTVVRTWAMRGTLHMVAAEDLAWLVDLLGPLTIKSDARRRSQLGLTDRVCDRALDVLPDVLTEPLPRAELIDRLNEAGVKVSRTGQAPPHLLLYAACSGVICRGPDLEKDEPSYVLVSSWLGAKGSTKPRKREDALRDLAERYLTGYGPATADDFTAWSGLPKGEAKDAMNALDADRVDSEIGELVMLPGSRGDDVPARLLGAFDSFLLGYRGRDLVLESSHARKVQAGGGMIAPTVLVDGTVVGTWKTARTSRTTTVTVSPFGSLPRGSKAHLEQEADDIGRFLGEDVTLKVAS